ncbi:MAG: hypothetical protein ABUS54_07690, partial [Actinomycetota bacterium]
GAAPSRDWHGSGGAVWIAPAALQLIPTFDRERKIVPELPTADADAESHTEAQGRILSGTAMRPRVSRSRRASPSIGFTQEGIDAAEAGGFMPADVSIGVSQSYLGETVNSAVAWWRIGAGFSSSPIRQLGDFFSTTAINRHTDQMSDPRLLFDATSGRWFFVAFDVTRAETDLAVSMSDDPTGSWWIYAFASAGCPDQPRLAVTDAMVAISYDLFSSCITRQQPYVGGVIRLFDKSAMLTGAAPTSSVFGPDARFVGITPVALLSGGSTLFFVSTDYLLSQVVIYTATSPTQASIPIQRAAVAFLRKAPPPNQLGTSTTVDPGDNRVQDAFLLGGNIWLAADDGCTVGGAFNACIRYEEITPGGQVLDQREEALAAGRSAMYPAFRPDGAGTLISVFGFSSPGDYPGLGVDIDPGHGSGYSELKDGTSFNASGRWGDYFSAAYDPADNTRVWVAGAYGSAVGWGTEIAALSTTPFTITNPTPPPIPVPHDARPPTVTALSSAGPLGGLVSLRYRLSDDSKRTREIITVYRGSAVVKIINTAMNAIANGSVYSAAWHAPRGTRADKFCVVAVDPAGNRSSRSCASLRLEKG